jgi:hypothetical protein
MERRWWLILTLGALVACGSGGDDDDDDDDDNDVVGADATPAPFCGDATCDPAENCTSCQMDCGACPPGCGDGTCNGTETCSSCENDCGVCPCTPFAGDCSGETVCIGTTCEAAFGRIWSITVVNAKVPTTNPEGGSWDALGGAPDPYVDVELNGAIIFTTGAVSESFEPFWDQSVEINVLAGSTLTFWVYDEDVAADDFVFGCTFDPLTAETLDFGVGDCNFAPDQQLLVLFDP